MRIVELPDHWGFWELGMHKVIAALAAE